MSLRFKLLQYLSVSLLLGSLSTVWGQTLSRISESSQVDGTDYTGDIRSFSEIGPGGDYSTTPRPWICYTRDTTNVVWQFPDGTPISELPNGVTLVNGGQLFTRKINEFGVVIYRGPDYLSPDGEYCCVRTSTDERRCVTLTSCPTLTPLTNERISYDPVTNVATYSTSCNTGYGVTGNKQRTCQSNGQWNGMQLMLTCEAITCSALPAISENGMPIVYSTDTSEPYDYGTTATYKCDAGYELTGGNTVRTCTGDGSSTMGQWSGIAPTTCSIVDCGLPIVPTHGDVNLRSATTTFNSVATYTCDSCYDIDGVSTNVCGPDGAWLPAAPTCIVIDCGSPTPPTNGQVQTSPNTECNSVATYSCNSGYDLVGLSSRVCPINGVWSDEAPVCRAVDCGSLSDPENGQVDTSSGTTFLSTAVYTCNDGYLPTSSVIRTCSADRQWRPAASRCDPVDCGPLTSPTNGLVDTSSGTILMSIALYTCDTGYNLIGVGSRICATNGTWSAAAPICEIVDCGAPQAPENGQVDTTESGTTYNSVATYSCDIGYELIGSVIRICTASGEWSLSLPSCTPVDCGDLQSPSNGQVDTSQGTFYTNTATYSCDTGYNLTGCAAAECLSSGSWSCNPPYCADNAMIQLKFSPTTHCVDWTEEKVLLMYQLMHSLIHEAIDKGGHVIPKGNIQPGFFSCFGSTTKTTFRTTITGIERVSAVDYADLIQEWVESGVTTRVQWYVIKIDKNCPVSIMSIDDEECV